MPTDEPKYISAARLGQVLGFSANCLRDLAASGVIPSLRIGQQRRFNREAVERALDELAAKEATRRRREVRSCPLGGTS